MPDIIKYVEANNRTKIFGMSPLELLVVGGLGTFGIYKFNKWLQEQKLNDFTSKYGNSPEAQAATGFLNAMNPSGIRWMMSMDGTNRDAIYNLAAQLDAKTQWPNVVGYYHTLTGGANLVDDLQGELNSEEFAKFNKLLNKDPEAIKDFQSGYAFKFKKHDNITTDRDQKIHHTKLSDNSQWEIDIPSGYQFTITDTLIDGKTSIPYYVSDYTDENNISWKRYFPAGNVKENSGSGWSWGMWGVGGYRWRPSKTQRREFAQRMQDPEEAKAYEERKRKKVEKRRAGSKYDYSSAGGEYVPTKAQHDYCVFDRSEALTPEDMEACDIVASGYALNEKVHHDYIHLVNEQIRRKASKQYT